MSLWSVSPSPAPPTPDALQLLADDQVVAEVVDPAAAELLGDGHPEEARGARLREQVAGDDAGGLPLEVVRGDLLLDEVRKLSRNRSCSSVKIVRRMTPRLRRTQPGSVPRGTRSTD